MTTEHGHIHLGLGDLEISAGVHVGHFYESSSAWKELALGFLVAGLEQGDKCLYMTDSEPLEELRAALAIHPVGREASEDQLLFSEPSATREELIERLHAAMDGVPERYPSLRWGADATAVLRRLGSDKEFLAWEEYVDAFCGSGSTFLCHYDIRAVPGTVVMDALRTHPVCVTGSAVHHNPFYAEPRPTPSGGEVP